MNINEGGHCLPVTAQLLISDFLIFQFCFFLEQYHEHITNPALAPAGFDNTNPALAGFTKAESGTALL